VILLEIENLGLPNKLGLLSMKARDTKENLFGNLQGSSILGNKTNMETTVPSQEQKMKHKLTIRFTLKKELDQDSIKPTNTRIREGQPFNKAN